MTQQPNERLLPCLDRLQRALDDTVEGIVEVSAADLREALSAWNTRVPAVQEGMVERLRKALEGMVRVADYGVEDSLECAEAREVLRLYGETTSSESSS